VRLTQVLHHPLVDLEEARDREPPLEIGRARAPSQERLERGAAHALAERGAEQDHAAGANHPGGRRDALDRLIKSCVERVAPRRGDHQVGRRVQRDQRLALDEAHALRVRLLDVPAEDAGDAALAVEGDVDEEVHADPAHDFEQRFVERIAFQETGPHAGLEQLRAVGHAYGLEPREPRAHALASSRVARHQVRLDQARDDAQVALQEEAIDQDRDAAARAPEVGVGGGVARVVLDDAQAARELAAEHLPQLRGGAGAMQAGRDQQRDRIGREPAATQRVEDGRQQDRIGHRAGAVRDHDHHVAAAPGELRERRRSDRVLERAAQGGRGIGQRSHRALLEQVHPRAARQLAIDLRASVSEADAHRATVSPAHALRQSLWYRALTGDATACARATSSGRCSQPGSRSRCRPRRRRPAPRRAPLRTSTASTAS
jgi:hypothetical protein